MLDIRAAIEKMLAAASGNVYLYRFAGDTSWDVQRKDLWPSATFSTKFSTRGAFIPTSGPRCGGTLGTGLEEC